jgi:hypothetical protein
VLLESGTLDLGSCAIPVVPELGGKVGEKTLSLRSSTAPTQSAHTLGPSSEIIAALPVATLLMA